MPADFIPNAEDVDKQILDEFLDEARDIISSIEVTLGNLRSGAGDAKAAPAEILRLAHSIKAGARVAGHPVIASLALRMEDYLADVDELAPAQVDDLQVFSDKIQGVLDGDIPAAEANGGELVRSLPIKQAFGADFEVGPPKNVEVLIIVPEKAMAHIVQKELAACGIRSTNVRNPFEAFEQAVRITPDLIVCSMELGTLSGVDLANAFAAMPKTREMPFALFTSYKMGHPALKDLPPRAAILGKGPTFGEDLAQSLSRFGIL